MKPDSASYSATSGVSLDSPKPKNTCVSESQNTADGRVATQMKKSTANTSDTESILKILQTIQTNQKSQDDKIAKMNSKVDELYNYGYEYSEYDESEVDNASVCQGNDDENANVTVDEFADGNNNEPPCKKQKVTPTNNKFANAGKKLHVKEVCDDSVDEELAKLVNDWFREGMEEGGHTDLIKTLNRPANATSLVTVLTNQMVWDFLSPSTRTNDKKMQNVQTSLIKGSIALTKLTQKMGKLDAPEVLDLIGNAMEALALLGHANRQLCMFRREAMKPDMKGEYSHLCSHNLQFTDFLFGDDVPKTVKDITDCSRISNRVGLNSGRGGGYRGRFSTRGRGRGRYMRGHGASRGRGGYGYGDSKNYSRRGQSQRGPQ